MVNASKYVAPAEHDDLAGLLEYIRHDPDLDSPHLAQVIVTYSRMIRIVRDLRRGQVELAAAHKMHVGDFDIMFVLQRAGERQMHVKDISSILRVTPGGVSKRIDRLVSAGFVRREASTQDRRASVLILTRKGIELANSARSRSWVKTFDSLDPAGWLELDALLRRMADAQTRVPDHALAR